LKSTPFKFKEHFEATANPKVSMLFSAIILSSTTVIIGCLVVLITESLYNLLYNLPSAPPEMGGLLGQSKNTINTIFVDSGKISFRKSCQYVPNEYRTGTLKELFLKEYFTPIKRGTDVNACHLRILSIFDQL
jgi:hypothetical protein